MHGVFNAGDATFGDDAFGSLHESVLELFRAFVLAGLEQFVEFGALLGQGGGEGEDGSASADYQRRINDGRAAGEDLKGRRRSGNDFPDALNVSRAVFDADDVGMFGESEDFGSFEGDTGELRDRIEKDGNGRSVGDSAVVADIGFGAIDGLVVVRSFDESVGIAEGGGAFRARDGFRGGFGAGAGDENLVGSGGFFGGDEDGVGLFAGEHDGFAGGAENDVTGDGGFVVEADVFFQGGEGDGFVGGERSGESGKDAVDLH